jgi:general secretion pathway protein D
LFSPRTLIIIAERRCRRRDPRCPPHILSHMMSSRASSVSPPRHRFFLGAAIGWLMIAATGIVAACTIPKPDDPAATSKSEAAAAPPARSRPPSVPNEAPVEPPPARPVAPTIISGTGELIAAHDETPPTAAEAGDITFNFVDTDVREVLRAVLGGVLHLNYAVDSKVQATITLQTSRPLQHDQVLPMLQAALRSSGLALVETAGVYRVVPLEEATRSGSAAIVIGQGPPHARAENPNYNVQIFPLKYVAAADMRQTIEPLLPKGAVLEVDAARNLIILSGSGQDLSTATELLRSFDVDWLKGMSFGIFPLQVSSPRAVAGELNTIFGAGGSVPLAGVLRFAPLERMNAILAVSPQRAYLEEARAWIERLDKGGDENTPRLYEYHVQNSRAADLAKVLAQLFSPGQVQTVEPQTAPDKAFSAAVQAGSAMLNGPQGGAQGGAMPGLSAPSPSPGTGIGAGAAATAPAPNTPPPAMPPPEAGGAGPARPQSPGLTSALGGAFGAERGGEEFQLPQVRIVADEKNNSLVIFARPRDYHMIEDALKRLDIVPLQVLIEATIAEVTLNDNLQYGLQWFFSHASNSVQLLNNNNSSGGTATGGAADIMPQFSGLSGFNYIVGGGQAKAVLSALSQLTNVNVISSPQLLVLDHHVASLQVGDEVPVPTAQIQSTITSGAPLVNTIQYLNTGVILTVSPRVNVNGVITLDISQEVSNVDTTAAASALNAPTISQRRVDTSVTVLDGETVALGGLITETRTIGNTGVPVLMDVPVLGSLFGTKQNDKARTELLILLSPRVVHNPAEARAATEELRGRLHTIAPDVGRIP